MKRGRKKKEENIEVKADVKLDITESDDNLVVLASEEIEILDDAENIENSDSEIDDSSESSEENEVESVIDEAESVIDEVIVNTETFHEIKEDVVIKGVEKPSKPVKTFMNNGCLIPHSKMISVIGRIPN